MNHRSLLPFAFCLLPFTLCLAQATPPIMPNIAETPLPPAIIVAPPATPAPADLPTTPLTADDAVNVAMSHQPEVKAALAALSAANGHVREVNSALQPGISVAAGYTGLDALAGPGDSVAAEGYTAAVTARQLLTDDGRTKHLVDQATEQLRAANAVTQATEAGVADQVKTAFYNALQAQQLVAVAESNLRNDQQHLALAQAQLNVGTGLPIDVARAETTISTAIFALTQARGTASSALLTLALAMGLDPRTPLTLANSTEPAPGGPPSSAASAPGGPPSSAASAPGGPPSSAASAPGGPPSSAASLPAADDLAALTTAALANRPEMAEADADVDAANEGLLAAQLGHAPSLVASAGWGDHGNGIPTRNGMLNLGVALEWSIDDGGYTAAKRQEGEAAVASAQDQRDMTSLGVTNDVALAYLKLKTAEQGVKTAQDEVTNAQESLRLAQGRYTAGLGVFLDVLDAQDALTTADTNQVNALIAVQQSRVALAHALGADVPALPAP